MVFIVRYMLVVAALAALACSASAAEAAAAAFRKPADRDKCPVCGMFVAKYPDWTAQALFKDGSVASFDGPKDLFKYLRDLKRYAPGRDERDIVAVYVTDYYSLRPVSGRSAFYVDGSDILGPMGRELIPFEREADAREFLKDHRGRRVLTFEAVTPDVLRSLE